tara:strand:- start:2532 stop:3056 length:525 start_codon:yes stop_codon:yes gene_type:complete
MLTIQLPHKVKFICGFIFSQNSIYKKAKNILEDSFGKIDFESKEIDFNGTAYYEKETGKDLKRRFISFKKLRAPSSFAAIKLFSIGIEKKFALNSKRKINIDPGYLNEAKLVLTTTKDFAHRIYLKQGVFAEVTLSFNNGKYRHFPTTFPDYRTEAQKNIFHSIRKIYREQLRK